MLNRKPKIIVYVSCIKKFIIFGIVYVSMYAIHDVFVYRIPNSNLVVTKHHKIKDITFSLVAVFVSDSCLTRNSPLLCIIYSVIRTYIQYVIYEYTCNSELLKSIVQLQYSYVHTISNYWLEP